MKLIKSKLIKQIISIFFFVLIVFSFTFSGTNYPFPIDKPYSYGIRITSYSASNLLNNYNTWKSRYVVTASPGQRVISPQSICVGN
ncbi:MAG: hypothetical protein N3E50_00700, partial [Candidatus Goldbacteria bacterium]|nr:hypothetical protein [Candidatus Goldiibacteriota bacterium]